MKKIDPTGRNTGRKRNNRRGSIEGQFIPHRRDLLESFPYRALPLRARKVLDRLEIEHMAHGGRDNGRLICTYDDFQLWGVDRNSIKVAIRELVALGLLRVSVEGRGGYGAEFRKATEYRLTYLAVSKKEPATDEWQKVNTMEATRAALASVHGRPKTKASLEIPNAPVGEFLLKHTENTPKTRAA